LKNASNSLEKNILILFTYFFFMRPNFVTTRRTRRRRKRKRTNKSAQLTTNQRAKTALRRATTGINIGMGCPPDPHQLNNPEDEDRDGLQNVPAENPKELLHENSLVHRENIKMCILNYYPANNL
jgi:hypothetical protein